MQRLLSNSWWMLALRSVTADEHLQTTAPGGLRAAILTRPAMAEGLNPLRERSDIGERGRDHGKNHRP
jgi:hypothetical protein